MNVLFWRSKTNRWHCKQAGVYSTLYTLDGKATNHPACVQCTTEIADAHFGSQKWF